MMYTKIQSHPLQDIYRLTEGVLLEVDKFDPYFVPYAILSKERQGKVKKIRGAKGIEEVTKDIVSSVYKDGAWVPYTVKKGTFLMHNYPKVPTSDPRLFTFNLKSSGGTISGDSKHHLRLLGMINEIISSYS